MLLGAKLGEQVFDNLLMIGRHDIAFVQSVVEVVAFVLIHVVGDDIVDDIDIDHFHDGSFGLAGFKSPSDFVKQFLCLVLFSSRIDDGNQGVRLVFIVWLRDCKTYFSTADAAQVLESQSQALFGSIEAFLQLTLEIFYKRLKDGITDELAELRFVEPLNQVIQVADRDIAACRIWQ